MFIRPSAPKVKGHMRCGVKRVWSETGAGRAESEGVLKMRAFYPLLNPHWGGMVDASSLLQEQVNLGRSK